MAAPAIEHEDIVDSSDCLTILRNNGMHLYECHPHTRHLYRTIVDHDMNKSVISTFAKMSQSTLVAVACGPDARHFAICSLAASAVVLRGELDFYITSITCSSSDVLFAGRTQGVERLALFSPSIDDAKPVLSLMNVEARGFQFSSDTGVLAYVPRHERCIKLAAKVTASETSDSPESEKVVDRDESGASRRFIVPNLRIADFGSIELKSNEVLLAISDDGVLLAIQRKIDDGNRKTQICIFNLWEPQDELKFVICPSSPHDEELFNAAFSADARFFVCTAGRSTLVGEGEIFVCDLQTKKWLSFFRKPSFVSHFSVRKVSSDYYVQLLKGTSGA